MVKLGKTVFHGVFVAVALVVIAFTDGCYRLAVFKYSEPKVCRNCHNLSEKFPGKEYVVMVEDVKFSLPFPNAKDSIYDLADIIHLTHYSRRKTELFSEGFEGDCWSCHEIDDEGKFRLSGLDEFLIEKTSREEIDKMVPYFQSWATSNHLDYTHFRNDVTCEMCHGKLLPKNRPTKEQCLECHGSYRDLAMMTEKEESLNPHLSHIGEVRCTYCHHSHKESKDYCNRCHDEIKFEVP